MGRMIPEKVLDQLSTLLTEYGTPPGSWEIVRASDDGNAALPKTHTENCTRYDMTTGGFCNCGAVDYAAVTIDVLYDPERGHRALFGVSDSLEVSLWMD